MTANCRAHRFGCLKASAVNRISEASCFGGCSSPFNQPVALSVFSGSGRSHPKHWNARVLLCLMILSGCSEVAIDCGDENTTNQCEKIIDECDKYAGRGPDVSPNTALSALHLACLNENKYSPTCDTCKRK